MIRSSESPLRVCIVGAGALGVWIGQALAEAGAQVSAVARGDTLLALQQHGLRVNREGDMQQASLTVSSNPAALGEQDLVVIAVKAPSLVQVAEHIAPLLGPDTVVLTAMNGIAWWFLEGLGAPWAGRRLHSVDPTGRIAACIAAQRVVGGVVHASCSLVAPGHAQHHFGKRIVIGEALGGPSTRVDLLAQWLHRAGLEPEVSSLIQRDAWYKLWGNMTLNPISAFTGATTDLILQDELVRGFVERVMLEARTIGERLGLPITQTPQDRHAVTRKLGAFKTSMLQDVQAARPVELDALVAAVRELGQFTGVPTPDTDALLGLARLHARVQGLY